MMPKISRRCHHQRREWEVSPAGELHQDLPNKQGFGHSFQGRQLLHLGHCAGQQKIYWGVQSQKSEPPTSKPPMSVSLYVHCMQELEKGAKPLEPYNYALEILITKSELEEKNGLISFIVIIKGLTDKKFSRIQFEMGDYVNSITRKIICDWLIIWDLGGQIVD